jgi:hypothetical protein
MAEQPIIDSFVDVMLLLVVIIACHICNGSWTQKLAVECTNDSL